MERQIAITAAHDLAGSVMPLWMVQADGTYTLVDEAALVYVVATEYTELLTDTYGEVVHSNPTLTVVIDDTADQLLTNSPVGTLTPAPIANK